MMEFWVEHGSLISDIGVILATIWFIFSSPRRKAHFFRVGDALSQLLNVLVYWENGTADASVSGDAFRFNRHKTRKVINFMFSWYEDFHCEKSFARDVERAERLAEEYGRTRVEQ